MTVTIRDVSHYDGNTDIRGFGGATHKITEGTSYLDPTYAGRMNGWRTSAGGQVLGSYHVLHTGNLSSQLDYWLSQQDKLTPWWRDWPHWLMQVDAEKWPGDPVTLTDGGTMWGPLLSDIAHRVDPAAFADHLAARISTTVAFAGMLMAEGLPCRVITYASRGQYGDGLTGIATDLWNAAYYSRTYPGDNAADWRPYSGKTPVLWQYTSTPYDKSAFRGSMAELLAYVGSGGGALAGLTDVQQQELLRLVQNAERGVTASLVMRDTIDWPNKWNPGQTPAPNPLVAIVNTLNAVKAKVEAGVPVSLSADDRAALVAALPSAADVAANLDYAKLAAALASHFEVKP